MVMMRCLATVPMLALLGCMTATTSGGHTTPPPAEPDFSQLDVKTAVPAPGDPSYAQTVEWLAGHCKQHATWTLTQGTSRIIGHLDLEASRYGCVLLDVAKMVNTRNGRNIEQVYLVSLPEVNLSSLVIGPSQVSDAPACLHFKGNDGVLIQLDSEPPASGMTVREKSRSRAGVICFDSREQAQRAVKAFTHAATLCGARNEEEPF